MKKEETDVRPKRAANATEDFEGFSDAEKEAMRDRAKELKAARPKRGGKKVDGESEVLEKIAAMVGSDREIGERLHALIKASAPELSPKTWYGMPAYANKDGKTICFFRPAKMFKERYMTFGFNQEANLDEGTLWPIAYALTELTASTEAKIGDLVKKAVS